jgi:hypothetical protein
MFVYDGLPDNVEYFQQDIDIYRMMEGASAIVKGLKGNINQPLDEYTITHVTFGGPPYSNGCGSIAICGTDNGVVEQLEDWKNNDRVAIFFNNRLGSPDMNIGRFSDLLTELEVSMKTNILFSRMYPIPVVSDSKIQTALEEAIRNILNGKIATVFDKNQLRKYLDDKDIGIDMVNITDVDKSSYIQYLAKMRDDLMRWFYGLYGMNSSGSSKLAQQTVDEVNQDSNASMILPHDMIREAKKGIDMCNQKFGWNASVSFSECWMSRLANFDDEFKETDEELEEVSQKSTEEEVSENETEQV